MHRIISIALLALLSLQASTFTLDHSPNLKRDDCTSEEIRKARKRFIYTAVAVAVTILAAIGIGAPAWFVINRKQKSFAQSDAKKLAIKGIQQQLDNTYKLLETVYRDPVNRDTVVSSITTSLPRSADYVNDTIVGNIDPQKFTDKVQASLKEKLKLINDRYLKTKRGWFACFTANTTYPSLEKDLSTYYQGILIALKGLAESGDRYLKI